MIGSSQLQSPTFLFNILKSADPPNQEVYDISRFPVFKSSIYFLKGALRTTFTPFIVPVVAFCTVSRAALLPFIIFTVRYNPHLYFIMAKPLNSNTD